MSWGLLAWVATIGLVAWLFEPPPEPPDNSSQPPP